MKLAIVGSVLLTGNKEAYKIIYDAIARHKATVIVSGGAVGIDSMAEEAAKVLGLETLIFRPERQRWEDADGKKGFKSRNLEIAQNCDALIRIVSSKTTTWGSGFTKAEAEKLGVPTENYVIET